jgi:hypothetical protein
MRIALRRLRVAPAKSKGDPAMSDNHENTDERASEPIAYICARGLLDPASLTLDEIQRVCVSGLALVPDYPSQGDDDARK